MPISNNSSNIPERNKILPAPNQFSHQLKKEEAYYFTSPMQGCLNEGFFAKGTKVLLVNCDGGGYCRVIDENGIYEKCKDFSEELAVVLYNGKLGFMTKEAKL